MNDIEIGAKFAPDTILSVPQRMRANGDANSSDYPPASEPIAATETKRRGKGAMPRADSKAATPPSQPTEIRSAGNSGPGDDGANMRSDTVARTPHVAPIEAEACGGVPTNNATPPSSTPPNHQSAIDDGHKVGGYQLDSAAVDGGGADGAMEQDQPAPPPPHPFTSALIQLQRQRTFAIKSQQRIDRACESFIASSLGFGVDLDQKQRKDIFARAGRIRRTVEKGAGGASNAIVSTPPNKRPARAKQEPPTSATDDAAVAAACSPIILNSLQARKAWDGLRKTVEAEMRKLAEALPVWPWAKSVKGFGALGVAIIAAEASGPRGDVGSYATKERLWKRLGLAVIEGERQRRVSNIEAAGVHGYNPRRRAEIWTIGDSMFRHQWAGADDDAGLAAHPTGPYGAVYMRRKAHTAQREAWNGMRKEADARRIMCKALVEDYWRVWRGLEPLAAIEPEVA